MEYYSAIQKYKILSFSTWMGLEVTMLGKMNKTKA